MRAVLNQRKHPREELFYRACARAPSPSLCWASGVGRHFARRLSGGADWVSGTGGGANQSGTRTGGARHGEFEQPIWSPRAPAQEPGLAGPSGQSEGRARARAGRALGQRVAVARWRPEPASKWDVWLTWEPGCHCLGRIGLGSPVLLGRSPRDRRRTFGDAFVWPSLEEGNARKPVGRFLRWLPGAAFSGLCKRFAILCLAASGPGGQFHSHAFQGTVCNRTPRGWERCVSPSAALPNFCL